MITNEIIYHNSRLVRRNRCLGNHWHLELTELERREHVQSMRARIAAAGGASSRVCRSRVRKNSRAFPPGRSHAPATFMNRGGGIKFAERTNTCTFSETQNTQTRRRDQGCRSYLISSNFALTHRRLIDSNIPILNQFFARHLQASYI